MIILRQKLYSTTIDTDKISDKLEKKGYNDFDISSKIPLDSISVSSDLGALKIYLPKQYEFEQYRIDDFLRDMAGHFRTRTVFDRNIYIMSVMGKLTEDQYLKLLQYIIDEEEFVTIIN